MEEKEIEIQGCFTVPAGLSMDELSDSFLRWVESNGWIFGGGFRELSPEESGYTVSEEKERR